MISKIILKQILMILCLTVTFTVSSSFAKERNAPQTIRLAIGEWAPYHSSNLKHYGLGSRIITEAFALEGVQVQYDFFPWARSLFYVESGDWEGSGIWYYSPKRAQYSLYSDTVLEFSYVFFHLKSYSFDWTIIEDLQEIPIGGVNR